jgi:hypothetical protein
MFLLYVLMYMVMVPSVLNGFKCPQELLKYRVLMSVRNMSVCSPCTVVGCKACNVKQALKEYRMVFRAGLRDPCTRDGKSSSRPK